MMKKIFLIIILLFPLSVFAMTPGDKECLQRGYNTSYQYCVFPNGSRCLLAEFNNGTCGKEYKNDNYCIPKGREVWDKDKCCSGLKPYLSKDTIVWGPGPTCEPLYYSTLDKFKNIFLFLINPNFWFYFIPLAAILYMIYWLVKRNKGQKF